jgi:hypothetical protein
MSHRANISIPDPLYVEALRRLTPGQNLQDYVIEAIRHALYGSPVEVELRRQNDELLRALRDRCGGGGEAPPPSPPPPTREPIADAPKRKGW